MNNIKNTATSCNWAPQKQTKHMEKRELPGCFIYGQRAVFNFFKLIILQAIILVGTYSRPEVEINPSASNGLGIS